MAQFFIDRPVFAWVIALFILVMGGVAMTQLPISQYPSVAPPSIVVTVTYPGASAQTLEDSVMVVGADGKVSPRPVKVGSAQDGQWIVLEGLKAGEQVMVDGFQKLQPGAPVKAVPWQPAAANAGDGASAAAAPKAAPAAAGK